MKPKSFLLPMVLTLLAICYTNCEIPKPGGALTASEADSNGENGGTTISDPHSRLISAPFTPPSNNFLFQFCVTGRGLTNTSTGESLSGSVTPIMMTLTSDGMEVGTLDSIPFAFDVLTMKIDNKCGTGYSMQVINENGEFNFTIPYRFDFDGSAPKKDGIGIELNFQSNVDQLGQFDGVIPDPTPAPARGTFIVIP